LNAELLDRKSRISFPASLRHRLILLAAIVLLIPGAFSIYLSVDHYLDGVKEVQRTIARQAAVIADSGTSALLQAEQLADSLDSDRIDLAAAMAKDVQQGSSSSADAVSRCNASLAEATRSYPAYVGAVVFGLQGRPLCIVGKAGTDTDVADRPWFQQVIEQHRITVGGQLTVDGLQVPVLTLGAPILDGQGRLQAVLGLALKADWLQIRDGPQGSPTKLIGNLVDGNGTPIVAANDVTTNENAESVSDTLPLSDDLRAALSRHQGVLDTVGKDGMARLYGISPLGNYGLHVVLAGDRAQLLAEPLRNLKSEVLTLLLILAAAFAAALLLSHVLILKWSRSLSRSVHLIGVGDPASIGDLTGAPVEFRDLNVTLQDMTVRLAAGKAGMEESLRQRKLMFRQLQHRVKNNLQIVISLLNLYVRLPRNEPVRSEIADLQVRLGVLALAQRQLYADEYREHIDVAPLIEGICNLLRAKTGVTASRVPFIVDIADVKITAEKAIPLALFVTEVLANSLEHAYPEPQAGNIRIEMKAIEKGSAMLTISDQGIGLLESPSEKPAGGLGRSLIAAFAKQLDGQLAIAGQAGTTTTLAFLLDRASPSAEHMG